MGHGFDTARLDRIPAFLEAKYVGTGRLPHAATLVSRRGEIAHLSCVGEARPGAALTEDAIFRIASMTKPITSIAFMMLVEEGKVALSDPLVKYLPRIQGHRRLRRGRRQCALPDPAADAADPHGRPAAPHIGADLWLSGAHPGRCRVSQGADRRFRRRLYDGQLHRGAGENPAAVRPRRALELFDGDRRARRGGRADRGQAVCRRFCRSASLARSAWSIPGSRCPPTSSTG